MKRVRTFRQYRDAPKRFPYDRYTSKGNYMILAELSIDVDPLELARGSEFSAALRDSVQWDVRLPYVRRELAVNHVFRDKADAASTLDARRAEADRAVGAEPGVSRRTVEVRG